ncbi:AsmA-like C-terminal region-containing protein [Formosa sp. PL04]|uniref:AsmA-like C-terminal region-containing protein n=1 Tax=Formosa sp. PL04 TaxID=3081755 RepID=UPI002982452C|nr:AsmA-like C-terminal region-containing protein [Formosa sp. PL04]MDW5288464.1 AsmA-like C-terminal region-containing protein [Formosa sp. PL04]
MLKKITKISIGLILSLGIIFGGIYFYVKRHKVEVVNFIVNTITENHNGSVHFDDINLKIWGNFTNPAFHVQNMIILDSTANKTNRLKAENLYLKLSIRHLLKKEIQVKSLRIENAYYNSVIYKEDTDSLSTKKDFQTKKSVIPDSFNPYKMDFSIENFTVDIQNIPRPKRFKFKINKVSSNLIIGPERITSSLDFDAHVTQLGFNLDKGSYLKDSNVKGIMHPEIDRTDNKIHIPSFDLSINEQIFKLTADFDTSEPGGFLFKIENEKTEYNTTLSLIPEHIQLKLEKYKISQAFFTQTTIQGSFVPLSNPLVHIKFNSVKNKALLYNRFDLTDLSFTGSFTNRIYDDERAKTESKKDIKLIFDSITGKYKESNFELIHGELISTPEDEAKIKGLFKAEGVPENLISFIKSPVFTLKKGHYNLIANLEGDATSTVDLLTQSNINLKVVNTSLFDLEDKLAIPVKQINVIIKEDRAVLDTLIVPLTFSDDINISGEVSHFSSILIPNPEISATTQFLIKSNTLRWIDFMTLFENSNKSTKSNLKEPADVLSNITRKIYQRFDPTLVVDIKDFEYKTYEISDLKTVLGFRDESHLHLKNTSFETRGGRVNLQASLDLSDAEKILIDSDVIVTGTSEILNDIFKSNTFFFKGGTFNLQGHVHGDILQIENFLNALNGNLRLKNSSVFYQPSNLTVPIDLLDVEIKNNLAILNNLEIGIGLKDKLNFSGKLDNFSAFLYSKNTKQINSFINLHSDRLQWDDFVSFFKKGDESERHIHPDSTMSRIKEILRGIQTSFNPKLDVKIDKFEYKNVFIINNFSTGIYFEPNDTLVLNGSSFDYNKSSKAELEAYIDISESVSTNINVDFKAFFSPEDLNKTLNNNTFLLQGGTIEMSAKIEGDIEKINKLVRSSSATVKINNGAFVYKPNKINLPFSDFELDIKNDDAFLKSLNIALPARDTIKLSGSLKNITSVIPEISGNNDKMSSKINIHSNHLQWVEFMKIFNHTDSEHKNKIKTNKQGFKYAAKDLYHKFQPDLSITIDKLIYKKFTLNDFKSGFYFENENVFHLNQTAFDFHKGKVSLDALLNIKDPYKTKFSIDVTTDKIDLEKLLISFDYFNTPSLKQADKIEGKVNLDSRIQGHIIDSVGVVSNKLKGRIGFNIQDLELKGFEPIIKIGNKIFKKKRVEDIRFSPIDNVLYLENNTIEFPVMEIQSTAFDLYVSGYLGFGTASTNLWTAIPLSNLKSRDSDTIPAKKPYKETGKKVFVNVVDDNKKGMKYKFYLSDKKYNKAQDSINKYHVKYKENSLQH